MADAVVSVVAERLLGLLEEQVRYHVNLVRGAEKEVRSLAKEMKIVRKVLNDAERKGFEEESIKDWLVRLEETSYEMEDVSDEWSYAILKLRIENHGPEGDDAADAVASSSKRKVWSCIPLSSCLCFKKVAVHHHVARKILDVKAQLDDILREKEKYKLVMSQPSTNSLRGSWRVQSNSSVELENVHGRVFDRDNIVSKLMVNGDRNIVSVVGVGGLGKTTLAQIVYNDSRVKEYFELRIWVCVSDPFDVLGIAKHIVEGVNKESSPNTDQLEVALERLREAISRKKFLLVLDDVWNEDDAKWEPLRINLKCGEGGSKILVTTRNETVARIMGTIETDIYRPKELSPEECWSLLRRISLFGRSEEECQKFHEVSKKIASKCKGLPLAATVLGGLLKFKDSLEEWENVLVSEIWQLEKVDVQLFPHLLLTYNELSPALKRCLSYCAVFPKDTTIDVDNLEEHWIAQGYLGNDGNMELKGQECFNNLAMRSLFLDFQQSNPKSYMRKRTCKMHDIVHDFAQSLRKDRSSNEEEARTKMPTCQRCNSLSIPNAKAYRSLSLESLIQIDICDCYKSLRVLSMRECRLEGISKKIEPLIHLRWLDMTNSDIDSEGVKTICKLYNLQFLRLNNCVLEEVPRQIGNLIKLRYLDLSRNNNLLELPERVCGLRELRTLDISYNYSISGLPEGISRLINLKHLFNLGCKMSQFPQELAELTSLRSLGQFTGGKGCENFGLLKNFKNLSGKLSLVIVLSGDSQDTAENVREADIRSKMHLPALKIEFQDQMDEKNDWVRMNVVEALEPHPLVQHLEIHQYAGPKLEGWITSPLCQLRSITLESFSRMTSLPPLGRLPCLEEVEIFAVHRLKFVGREFLGLTGDMGIQSSSNTTIGFPRLKKLKIFNCSYWEEWEDITEEEEDSASLSFMPCLEKLEISYSDRLMVLPHRLLGKKAFSLEYVEISDSSKLVEHYENMEGAAWDQRGRRLKVQLHPK